MAGLESCGAVDIVAGTVGNYTGTWNAITAATYVPPAGALRNGIVGNTFRTTPNPTTGSTNPM